MTKMVTQLTHRGVLEIQGEDKAAFLQGLISNDIHAVTPEQAIYATFLSAQGRFLYDFFIMEKEGSYFLDTETERIEAFTKKLSLYKLRSDVILTLRPDLKVFVMWGEGVAPSLHLPEKVGSAEHGVFMDPRLLELGARSIGEISTTDFQLATPRDYDLHRLTLGIPEGGKDLVPEKSIPLECGFDELNAISWTKGCYMGQELTARTKYRGLVRKRLFPVKIKGPAPLEGREIFLNDQPVGEMRTHQGLQGLAMLRFEALKTFQEGQGQFVCDDAVLEPYIPFWMRLEEPS